MNKDKLLASAKKLTQPQVEVAAEFGEKKELLASAVNQKMYARPDLERLVGQGSQLMLEDNNRNHVRFMESIFCEYNPEVLVETVLWVFRTYRSHGFQLAYWPASLDTWVEILQKELSAEAFKAVYPFYNWLIINNPTFVMLTDSQITAADTKTY